MKGLRIIAEVRVVIWFLLEAFITTMIFFAVMEMYRRAFVGDI